MAERRPTPFHSQARLAAILRRCKALLHRLAPRLHDRVMGRLRRIPRLEARLQALKRQQQIRELEGLVRRGETEDQLSPAAATRLHHYLDELRREAHEAD